MNDRLEMAGYRVTEIISKNERSIVYRGVRLENNQPVMLKMLKEEYLSIKSVSRIRNEFTILQSINSTAVTKAVELVKRGRQTVLVTEDYGGISLELYVKMNELSVKDVISICIRIAECIHEVHKHRIIHKDINPSNILIHPGTKEIKLIDFGIATRQYHEKQSMSNSKELEGSSSYMSPEQTGRMNRSLDYRTDFYSFGITAYEMLTGYPPFRSNDLLELVHAIIAVKPVPPCEVNNVVPKPLSDIVMKCLSKNAEDRYHSVHGLLADLQQCWQELEEMGTIQPFSLGRHDLSDRLRIPQKLYGREQDISTLTDAFKQVCNGATRLFLISGNAGVGKSALVQELQKSLLHSNGRFISGKFDQYKQNIPYQSLIQAFQELIRQLLSESKEELDSWRENILEAVQGLAQVVVDVIPQLETIIGKQPPVPDLPAAEAKNRFQLVMQRFVRVLARPEHPLVLFLDDLQWADTASLHLLHQIITDLQISHLLLIGAYRSNEVGPAHPLMTIQKELSTENGMLQVISLQSLRELEMNHMLVETIHTDPLETESLTRIIVKKTEGNPFFAREFLKSLHDSGLLWFSEKEKRWLWNAEQIEKMSTAANVADFLVEKIRKLPVDTQILLGYAACLGNTFSLSMIAEAYGLKDPAALRQIWPAIVEGLLYPMEDEQYLAYVALDEEDETDQVNVHFSFVHDRLQQAANSLLSDEDRKVAHLRIGIMMQRHYVDTSRDGILFEMCDHLYQAAELIDDHEDKHRAARLHLLAGQKAKSSAAYDAALKYLRQGTEILPGTVWNEDHNLAMELYILQSEAEYLCNRFDEAEVLFDLLLCHAQTELEHVRVLEIKIQMYTSLAKFQDVVDIAKQALQWLGVNIPVKPSKFDLIKEVLSVKRRLIGRSTEQLVHLPTMEDEYIKTAMKIISVAGPSSYFVEPNWFALSILRVLHLSIVHGNDVASANGYTGYGIVLCSQFGNYEAGYSFGELACKIAEQFSDPLAMTKAYGAFAILINHWKNHAKTNIPLLTKATQYGVVSGSNIYVAYNTLGMFDAMLFCGYSMEEIQKQIQLLSDLISQVKIVDHDDKLFLLQEAIHCLTEIKEDQVAFDRNGFDEQSYVKDLQEQEHSYKRYIYHFHKFQVLYLFGQYREAAALAFEAEKWMESVSGQVVVGQQVFMQTLSLTAMYPTAKQGEKRTAAKKIKSNLRKMKKWAIHCPENYQHKYLLMSAEWAFVRGQKQNAASLYEQAIQSARKEGFVQNEGIACERTAVYYLANGFETIAKLYMNDAYEAYLQWGATAKARDIKERYGHLLNRTETSIAKGAMLADPLHVGSAREQEVSSNILDLMTVIRASQTIASEIKLDKLLATMLRTVISNAGAEKGFLILKNENNWVIEAAGSMNQEVEIMQSVPYEKSGMLSVSVVNYAIRTEEIVVLHHASIDEKYAKDSYIQRHQPKSVLCSPLWLQGKMIGIIYLENNVTTHVFLEERIELLQMIFSQIAIFIENARLYHQLEKWNRSLEKTVEKRTEEIQKLLRENKNLLDNAGQGFLLISRDLIVHSEYSRECLRIFGKEIAGFSVTELFYPDKEEERVFVESVLEKYFETERSIRKDVYLSLLPSELIINQLPVKLESKPIYDAKGERPEGLMLILTDLSEKRALESKMQKEWQILKMVVTVVTNLDIFHEAVKDFSTFCQTEWEPSLHDFSGKDEALVKVLGTLHTFKGDFSQLQMIHTTQKLQELETTITEIIKSGNRNQIDRVREELDLSEVSAALQEDMSILKNTLGEEFLERNDQIVSFKQDRWKEFETKLVPYLQEQGQLEMLHDVMQLHHRPLRDLLKRYPEFVCRVAENLGKKIVPLRIEGGNMLVDPEHYGPFAESLIHVFRNAIDHGIEDAKERQKQNKDVYGMINCVISQVGEDIVVTISDDGKGIDLNDIKVKAYEKGLCDETAEMWNEQEWMNMIFADVFSTKEEIGELSGLGMGLSIVKKEVERLNGRINVRSSVNEGTSFIFQLPGRT